MLKLFSHSELCVEIQRYSKQTIKRDFYFDYKISLSEKIIFHFKRFL